SGGILWFVWISILQLFQFFLQVFAAFDFACAFEADHVRLAAGGGHGGHLVDEIRGGLNFLFPRLPLASKDFGRRLRVVVAAVADEGGVLQVLKSFDKSLNLVFLGKWFFSRPKIERTHHYDDKYPGDR